MDHGLARLRGGFPLSLRLFKEIHEILLQKGRGSHQTPGEFRRSQNWVGGSRPGNAVFVPPPPEKVSELLGDLELFLHNKPRRLPTLIKAALAHVQFETIPPLLDGNGRLGRLLITFLICAEGLLHNHCLSELILKTAAAGVLRPSQRVRREGDWEAGWHFSWRGARGCRASRGDGPTAQNHVRGESVQNTGTRQGRRFRPASSPGSSRKTL